MFEPILLTEHQDRLCAWSDDHDTDKSELPFGGPIGSHEACKGSIVLKTSSTKYNVLLCKYCELRIVIPNTVSTYGELRTFLKNAING